MKRIFLFLILLFTVSSLSLSQTLAKGRYYAQKDSTHTAYTGYIDTTAWVNISGAGNKVLSFHAYDSCNVSINLDYRDSQTGSSYTYQTYAVVSDSTNSTTAVGFFKGYVLIFGTTNNIPGAVMARLRVAKKLTKNGINTPTYDAVITGY